MNRLRLYLCGRLCDEHEPHRAELLDVVGRTYPSAEIIDGTSLWRDNDDWLASWRELLPTLDRVIVLPGPRGEVGLGGLQEVVDAWTHGIPVEIVTIVGVRPIERLRVGTDVLDLEHVGVVI